MQDISSKKYSSCFLMFHNPVYKTKTLEPGYKSTIINYYMGFNYSLSQRNYV